MHRADANVLSWRFLQLRAAGCLDEFAAVTAGKPFPQDLALRRYQDTRLAIDHAIECRAHHLEPHGELVRCGRAPFPARVSAHDFERRSLVAEGALSAGRVAASPKVERSPRTIPVDPALLHELRQRKAEQAATGLQLGIAQTDDWLIFPSAPDRPSGFCQGFKHKLQRTSYAHISPHDLRHAHGSILLAQGVSLPTLAARLGHSTAVCASTYAHQIEGHDAAAMVKFGRSVAEGGKTVPGSPAAKPELMVNHLMGKAA